MREADGADIYEAQRDELKRLLKSCFDSHQPLKVLERPCLSADDIAVVLQKIKNRHHFSRKERQALTEAGFQLDKIYPGL